MGPQENGQSSGGESRGLGYGMNNFGMWPGGWGQQFVKREEARQASHTNACRDEQRKPFTTVPPPAVIAHRGQQGQCEQGKHDVIGAHQGIKDGERLNGLQGRERKGHQGEKEGRNEQGNDAIAAMGDGQVRWRV